ncbi:MAG: hypothetical protein ACTSU5_18880 [Promethearchaeota archaeon]
MVKTTETYTTGSPAVHDVKRRAKHPAKCPVCGEAFSLGVEAGFLATVDRFPFPHVLLHGSPLHALVAYVDQNGDVRGVESTRSVEVLGDGPTFQELLAKWSNPF